MERTPRNHVSEQQHTAAPTIVTEGSKLTGELIINGKLHIDGEVCGSLYATSEISIAITGKVDCQFIKAHSVIVSGCVKSDIYAEIIEIMSGGLVEGNLYCKKIAVELGGMVVAKCSYKPFNKAEINNH